MADGKVVIETGLDSSGIEKGLSKLSSLTKTGLTATTAAVGAVSAALSAAGGFAIKTGIEFESAFAGVKKTVDATDVQLETLRTGILNMSKEIPQSASSLAQIGEAAGQLGIKTENIQGFIEVMANLGVATNMSSDQAATALARLANITGMPQTQFDRLGSTIVALGNNLATTESEITEMGLRLAGAGSQVGMTEAQIMSFAGALSSVGIEAEAGGSAFSKVMVDMQLAAETGGESLENFASVAGMSADDFKQAFEKDAAGAMMAFIKGLSTCDERGISAIKTLDDMGISEVRMRDALLRAAGASDTFSEALEIGTQAWEENTALTKEAEQRYDTLESKLQLMKNSLSILAISFKDSIDTQLRSAVEAGIGYVDELSAAFDEGGLQGAVAKAGDIFAEIAVKAAEAAPKMIDAAVAVIESFVQGIIRNKAKLGKAALNIVKALADGLIKLLPKSMQRPVQEAINAMVKSFESGGLKKAIETIGKVIENLGKIIGNLAKVVLPPLTAAFDFLGNNLNIVIPLVAAAGTALAAYHAAVAIAAAKTALLTAAQTALNAVMSANPIALFVTGIAALGVAIGTAISLQEDYGAKLQETNESLGESYGTVGQAAADFYNTISVAGSIFDNFNESLIVSTEKQQELATEMDAVQSEITQIAQTATSERRELTQAEIDRLDELFEKMRELTARELKYQMAYQTAVQDAAQALATSHQGTAEEYKTSSAKIINSANETRDTVVNKAYEQMLETNAINKQLIGTKEEYSQEWYNKQCEAAQADYDLAVSAADKQCADTLAVIQQGYADRMTSGNEYFEKIKEANSKEEAENARYNQAIEAMEAESQRKIREGLADSFQEQERLKNEKERAEEEHRNNLSDIRSGIYQDMTSAQAEQAGVWLAMIADTALYGGEMDTETQSAVDSLIDNWDKLPPECQDTMRDTLQGMVNGMRKNSPELLTEAQSTAGNFLQRLSDELGVHSPSWKTRDMFTDVVEGAKEGLTENADKLYQTGSTVIDTFLLNFDKPELRTKPKQAGTDAAKNLGDGLESADVKGTGQSLVSGLITVLLTGIRSQFSNLTTAGKGLGNAINNGLKSANIGNFATQTVSTMITTMLTAIRSKYGTVTAAGKTLGESVITGIKNARMSKGAVDEAAGLITKFVAAIDAGRSRVSNAGKSLAQSASDALKNYGLRSDGWNVGNDLVTGFCQGISANTFRAQAQARAMAIAALNAAKNALGIRSPSREGKKIGAFFDEGVALGIDQNVGEITKSTRKLSKELLSGIDVSAAVAKMKAAVSEQSARISTDIVAPVMHKIVYDTNKQEKEPKVIVRGEIHTHVDLDKKELGIAITPIVSEELAFSGG